jgi:hypothetical protein
MIIFYQQSCDLIHHNPATPLHHLRLVNQGKFCHPHKATSRNLASSSIPNNLYRKSIPSPQCHLTPPQTPAPNQQPLLLKQKTKQKRKMQWHKHLSSNNLFFQSIYSAAQLSLNLRYPSWSHSLVVLSLGITTLPLQPPNKPPCRPGSILPCCRHRSYCRTPPRCSSLATSPLRLMTQNIVDDKLRRITRDPFSCVVCSPCRAPPSCSRTINPFWTHLASALSLLFFKLLAFQNSRSSFLQPRENDAEQQELIGSCNFM